MRLPVCTHEAAIRASACISVTERPSSVAKAAPQNLKLAETSISGTDCSGEGTRFRKQCLGAADSSGDRLLSASLHGSSIGVNFSQLPNNHP
jgi:hypothetical protein